MAADDVVFTLRFQTGSAERTISSFTQKLSRQLKNSLKLPSNLGNITKALGLDDAAARLKQINEELREITKLRGRHDKPTEKQAVETARLLQQRENLLVKTQKFEKKQNLRDDEAARLFRSNQALQGFTTKATGARLGVPNLAKKDFLSGSTTRLAMKQTADETIEQLRLASKQKLGREFQQARGGGDIGLGAEGSIQDFRRRQRDIRRRENLRSRNRPVSEEKKGLGISKTAETLLAFSSIVAPLSPQLGATLMQAGFAGFTKGAIFSALSLGASALKGIADGMVAVVKTSKAAGLETVAFSKATIGLKVRMNVLRNLLGVKIQGAFTDLINRSSELFRRVENLPWDLFISQVQSSAESIMTLVEALSFIPDQVSRATTFLGRLVEENPFASAVNRGRTGTQRIQFSNLIRAMIDPAKGLLKGEGPFKGGLIGQEIRNFLSPDQTKDEGFVFTPKFAFRKIEDVGKSIQAGILKQAGKTPEERAIDISNALLREVITLMKNGKTLDPVKASELIRERLPMGLVN